MVVDETDKFDLTQASTKRESEIKTIWAPAWFVKSTNKSGKANMDWTTKKAVVSMKPGTSMSVEVPVLTNTKPVQIDDELLIYVPHEKNSDDSDDDDNSGKAAAQAKPKGKAKASTGAKAKANSRSAEAKGGKSPAPSDPKRRRSAK